MEDKCAIYVRVSSDLQDYERQITDLKQFATSTKLIIPEDGIFEDKLSGFKDESERRGLKNLMDYCINQKIVKVLIWEISRLARKHVVLLNLIEFFKKNRINVYFLNQSKWLLDDNGNVGYDIGMMTAVLGWFSEYETKLMLERFRSKKLLNESLGIYNGGKIPFGFKLDTNKKYVIDEEKIVGLEVSPAGIVREVFEYYESGLVCSKICRITNSKGYPKIVTSTHTLARLLRNTSYIGFSNVRLGRRPTPAIISESQFYKVNSLIDSNKTKADKGRKHIYLLRGLLKCSYCNDNYVGKQTDDGYICPKNSGSNKTNKNTSCKGGNISISNIDGIIWSRTKFWLSIYKVSGFDEKDTKNSKIDQFNQQINRYSVFLEDIERQKSKINFMYKKGGYTSDEYVKEIAKNRTEQENYKREIGLLQSEISLHEKTTEQSFRFSKRVKNIKAIQDRNQMKEIIRGLISEIHFYKVDLFKTVVVVRWKIKQSRTEYILYNSVAKKGNIYKVANQDYFRFDNSKKLFYVIKDPESVKEYAGTITLKENSVGSNLPDYIPYSDFSRLTKESNREDIRPSSTIYLPVPDDTNSYVVDFNTLMNTNQFKDVISARKYEKLEYFKGLNKSRFNRKRGILGKGI
jgi:site-specific DNA recombinase